MKWINTTTGLEVPASEVRELLLGSGIFVHEATATVTQLTTRAAGPRETGVFGRVFVETPGVTTKYVDGYAVRLDDDVVYDPAVHSVQNQVLRNQVATSNAQRGTR